MVIYVFVVTFGSFSFLIFLLVQFLNYRLHGIRLCERRPPVDIVDAVMHNVLEVRNYI